MGDLLWTLFNRGDVSSNWNLSFLSATKYYIFVLRSFFTLPNSAYRDEMPHDGILPVYKFKKHVPKYISQLKCRRISFLKLFLVPYIPYMYAFTSCNLRVGKFDVYASNMIIFWRQYFTKLRLMDSGNA